MFEGESCECCSRSGLGVRGHGRAFAAGRLSNFGFSGLRSVFAFFLLFPGFSLLPWRLLRPAGLFCAVSAAGKVCSQV